MFRMIGALQMIAMLSKITAPPAAKRLRETKMAEEKEVREAWARVCCSDRRCSSVSRRKGSFLSLIEWLHWQFAIFGKGSSKSYRLYFSISFCFFFPTCFLRLFLHWLCLPWRSQSLFLYFLLLFSLFKLQIKFRQRRANLTGITGIQIILNDMLSKTNKKK